MRDQLRTRSTVVVVAPSLGMGARIRNIAHRDKMRSIAVCIGCRCARVARPLLAGRVGFCRDCLETGYSDLGGES